MKLERLYREQERLARKVELYDAFGKIRYIAGVDCSYPGDRSLGGRSWSGRIIGGAVVLDFETLEPVARAQAVRPLQFPYIPGLLAYREAGAMIAAFRKVGHEADVLMVDGFGVNHPRRCGIASHIGLKLDMPTIGVGKSFLCGEIDGTKVYQSGEQVGELLCSPGSKKPVYVSPGHKITLETAAEIVVRCTRCGRLPEPARLAHEHAGKIKRELEKATGRRAEP